MRYVRILPLLAHHRHSIHGSFYYDYLSSKITELFLSILINYGTLRLFTHFTQKVCNERPLTTKIDGFHFVSLDFSFSFLHISSLLPFLCSLFPFLSPPLSPSASPVLLFLLHHPNPSLSFPLVTRASYASSHQLCFYNELMTLTPTTCLGKVCFKQLIFHGPEPTIIQVRAKAKFTILMS